jgi:iron(II)-dependent oxidoreductase
MDRLEVTVEQFQACVDAGICNGNVSNDGACNYDKAGREQHPMNCVSWQDATVFCAWKGQLLPSEAQWERAARGGCELFTSQECATVFPKYPWGNGGVTCDLAAISGCGETSTGSHQVGSYPAGVSPYGVYDMAGNVAEWTRDWYSAFYYSMSSTINPIGPTVGSERSVRGSSYLANVFGSSTLLAIWFRESMAPDKPQAQIGFRCVKSAN